MHSSEPEQLFAGFSQSGADPPGSWYPVMTKAAKPFRV